MCFSYRLDRLDRLEFMSIINDLTKIYTRFPRNFFTTYSWRVDTMQQFLQAIAENIATSRCSTSIYDYYHDCPYVHIDRVIFDLDSNTCHTDALKLHGYLLNENIKHFMVFSGYGFHFYAKVKPFIAHEQNILKNISLEVEKKVGFRNDISVRGNIAHNLAIPYTFNYKRMKYVRLLSERELELSYVDICKLAEKQGGQLEFYGHDTFDAQKYDTTVSIENEKESESTTQVIIDSIMSDKLSMSLPFDCQEWLSNSNLMHSERLKLIYGLMNFGLSRSQVVGLLRKYLSPQKFRHCVYNENMVVNVFKHQYD